MPAPQSYWPTVQLWTSQDTATFKDTTANLSGKEHRSEKENNNPACGVSAEPRLSVYSVSDGAPYIVARGRRRQGFGHDHVLYRRNDALWRAAVCHVREAACCI